MRRGCRLLLVFGLLMGLTAQTVLPVGATESESPVFSGLIVTASGQAGLAGTVAVEEEKSAPENKLPAGTLGPVTLKSFLQKTKSLPLTLEQSLNLALGQNIAIDIAEEALLQKRIEYRYRLSDLLPDLTMGYRQSRFVGAMQIFGGETLELFRTTYQPQLTAEYTVYTGGKNIFEIRASKQRREAQRNLLEETRQDTLTRVATAYYTLQQAYWQRAIALQAIKEAEDQVKLNEARLESGIGIRLEVLQAQTFLANRKRELLAADSRIVQESQHLAQLLNLDLDADILPPSLESTVSERMPEGMTFSQMRAVAQAHHPKLKTLQNLLKAAQADSKAAFADIFPKIDITAYINGTGPGLGELGLSRFAGVNVSTNLLDNAGLGHLAKVKGGKTLVRMAELNLKQAERLLEENLANTLVDMQSCKDQIEIAKEALKYANATYLHAHGRLKEGLGTHLDLENALSSLTQARSDLAMAFLNYNKAQVALLSHLGVISIETLTQGYMPDGTAVAKP